MLLTKLKKKTEAVKEKIKIIDIFFAVFIIAFLFFAFWKCRYGFGGNDEAFYLTVPHRITLGDIFVKDEWHLSQLSGFLTLPFVKLYTIIMGGTTGIMLAMRYIYIAVHFFVSVFLYVRLRRFGYGSLVASILYFIFTPFDIMTLSYNTMGLELVTVFGILMATADYSKRVSLIIAGMVFAGAVLCNPYMAIVYIIYAVIVLAVAILKKVGKAKRLVEQDYFSVKSFVSVTIGISILALAFFLLFFSRADISDITNSFSYIMSDPEHPQIPFLTKLSYYWGSIWNCTELFKFVFMAYVFLLGIMYVDNKRKAHSIVYLVITCVIVIFLYCTFMEELVDRNFNHIMFPAVFLGITSYVLCENKNKGLFIFNFCLGIIYSIVMCFASNQYFAVQAMAIASSNISSFVFTGILIKEIVEARCLENTISKDNKAELVSNKKATTILVLIPLMIVAMFQGTLQVIVKANHVFWDYKPSELNVTISEGPALGLITNNRYATSYQTVLSDINKISENNSGKKILFLTETTWTYLASENMEYATFSSWISGENDLSLLRLQQYYSVNPQKVPQYIYIPYESKWDINALMQNAINSGYTFEQMTGGILLARN